MHSRVSWWTDESIRWFERASKASTYHRCLTSEIEKHINKDESVIEFGCGLGYEAQLLSDDGYEIKAFDKDSRVIDKAKKRTGKDIFFCADASAIVDKADIVLCINYGHIEDVDDLKAILSHAKKKLVYVISRHSGHNQETRPDRTELICRILDAAGMVYSKSDFSLDFNQPLTSMEEASKFIRWTYLERNEEEYMKYVRRSEDSRYPFCFMNRKNMVLFSIKV